jgi:hypothetical protein
MRFSGSASGFHGLLIDPNLIGSTPELRFSYLSFCPEPYTLLGDLRCTCLARKDEQNYILRIRNLRSLASDYGNLSYSIVNTCIGNTGRK